METIVIGLAILGAFSLTFTTGLVLWAALCVRRENRARKHLYTSPDQKRGNTPPQPPAND